MDKYREENKQFLNDLVDQVLHKNWDSEQGIGLEIIITPECNLSCSYCYMYHFGDKLYKKEILNDDTIIMNTKLLFDYIFENDLKIPRIDLFSGEVFAQELGFRVVEEFRDALIRHKKNISKIPILTIPTNFTWIHDDELTNRVVVLINEIKNLGSNVYLSASFDGKHMEKNRTYKKDIDFELNQKRDDEYYDKVFQFIKEHGTGLHPMIYSKRVEDWKENFLWFQSMLEKHEMSWKHIYLLQVRNVEWKLEECKELVSFIEWLYDWTFEKLDRDKDKLLKFITKAPNYGFNILKSTIGKPGRGLPCSIQSSPSVRLGDLALVPCHRLMYEGQEYGKFIIEDGKMTGELEPINPEMFVAVMSHDYRTAPYCSTCGIKNSCNGGCLGSQYEVTGDPFTPIPTTCLMQHALMLGVIKGMRNTGIYNYLLENMNTKQMLEHDRLIKEMNINYGI